MPGSEAMQPAIVTGFATYALVIASPAVFLTLALRWFSEPAPAPAPWFGSGPMRWRQVTATEASRHRLYGPYGIMFRSEEHTSELQSLMRISYAVFCLKKKISVNRSP